MDLDLDYSVNTPDWFRHFDLLQDLVIILDSDRTIVGMNAAARARYGEGHEGRDVVRIIRNREFLDAVHKTFLGENVEVRTITLEQPGRAVFRISAELMEDDAFDQPAVMISLKDVSELQEAEQFRSEFVANVSHELRSPLTALSGFIETLQQAGQDDPLARERFLSLMGVETERMIRLVADLLSLSKVEANQRVRPSGTASLPAIINRVCASLERLATKRNKEVEINIDEKVSTVPGSEDELQQVFQNLIENSLKYSDEGTPVRISAKWISNAAGMSGPAIRIDVEDQGNGIEKHHLARLTERFYRVDSHRARNQGGTGLGLAIVKHIVQRHRGRLKIDSEAGQGSRFTVYLPAEV